MSVSAGGGRAAPVELFSTSILGNHKIRSRHERYVSVLAIKKVPYVYHDLASDEEAKSRWRRKARDPQIPGLLVHNEWRGTFEEFEEAIEFGELDLFLKIDYERAQREAAQGLAPTIAEPEAAPAVAAAADTNGADTSKAAENTERKTSKHIVNMPKPLAQPRAPSNKGMGPSLPAAASRSAKRASQDVDSLFSSLGLSDVNLSQQEIDEILQAGSSNPNASTTDMTASTSGSGFYPDKLGLGSAGKLAKPVQRTYIPSAEAGVKPLRLAKMGSARATSSADAGAQPHARYNASIMSSKALAAEAQASASSRALSASRLREAVAQGDNLKEAMSSTRAASNVDAAEQIVGREDLDSLMASLGLSDVKMTDDEAEAFLFQGTIPEGMMSGGSRLGRTRDKAELARKETAARDLAHRAKEKGYGSPQSPTNQSDRSSMSSIGSPMPMHEVKTMIETQAPNIGKVSGTVTATETAQVSDEAEKKVTPPHVEALRETDDAKDSAQIGDQTTLVHDEDDEEQEPAGAIADLKNEAKESEAQNPEETPKPKDAALPETEKSADTVLGEEASLGEELKTSADDRTPTKAEPELQGTDEVKNRPEANAENAKSEIAGKDTLFSQEGDLAPSSLPEPKADEKQYSVTILSRTSDAPVVTSDEAAASLRKSGSEDAPPLPEKPNRVDKENVESTLLPSPRADSFKERSVADDRGDGSVPPASISSRKQEQKPRPPSLSLEALIANMASFGDGENAGLNLISDTDKGNGSFAAPKTAPLPLPPKDKAQDPGPSNARTRSSTSGDVPAKSPKSPISLARSPQASSGRRRAIDVHRSMSSSSGFPASPSLSINSPPLPRGQGSLTGTSPLLSSSPGIPQSSSQSSNISLESKNSVKSSKKFFSLPRRRSQKFKRGRKSSAADDMDSEEEISTTFENPPLSSNNVSNRTPTSIGDSSLSTDRSQKTLSVILREADEVLTGYDDEHDKSDDDVMGSFDFELDAEDIDHSRR